MRVQQRYAPARAVLGRERPSYCEHAEAVPRKHARRHLPHQHAERKAVRLERHARVLQSERPRALGAPPFGNRSEAHQTHTRIRHGHVPTNARMRLRAHTWSCSGDMNAGVPLKPVFATVSIRFSFRATPAERTRLKDPFHHSTGLRPSFRTEVADADFQVAVQLFEQNVEGLDVTVNDLRSNVAKVLAGSPNSEAAAAAATDTGTASSTYTHSRRGRQGRQCQRCGEGNAGAHGTRALLVVRWQPRAE